MLWKAVPLLLFLSCLPHDDSVHIGSLSKVIYGKDHRQEFHESPLYWREKSRAVAAKIHRQYLEDQGDVYRITSDLSWDDNPSFCPDERFYGQPLVAGCSGFLIAPSLILTAGHCLPSCPHFVWVFDYHTDSDPLSIPRENVHSCSHSEILYPAFKFGEGFGLVHLDRPVPPHRTPLPLRKGGVIGDRERVVLMGHPLGLPLKMDRGPGGGGNTLRENSHPLYFVANLDSYSGNSGSPVLNAKDGLVEGVLIGGEGEDFLLNTKKNCYQSKRCSAETCRGEGVLRITPWFHEKLQSARNTAQ